MSIPPSFLFWGCVIAYCMHVVEESTVGGGFVAEVRRAYWPEYSATRYFWLGAGVLALFSGSIVLYEVYGGAFVIGPLTGVFMFSANGVGHVIQTARSRRFSPGLITSPVYWIVLYFILRYCWLPGKIATRPVILSACLGSLIALLTAGALWRAGRRSKRLAGSSG
jgi:hypothetical protein